MDPLVPLSEPVIPIEARSNIVVVGRIFTGRSSKGHDHAIELLRELLSRLPNQDHDITLLLVGHLQPGHVSALTDASQIQSRVVMAAQGTSSSN